MAHAELAPGGHVEVTAGYNDRHLVAQLPGSYYVKSSGSWAVPLSWPTCVMLRGLFGKNLTLGPELAAWAWKTRQERLDPATELRDVLDLNGAGYHLRERVFQMVALLDGIENDPARNPSGRRLFPYQRVDLAFLVLNRRDILGNEPGLGKTGAVIRTLQVLRELGEDPFPALITCPNSLKRTVWAKELALWAPELTVSVVDGGMATRRKQLEVAADCYVINWEGLRLHSRLAPYGQQELTAAEKTPKELNHMSLRTAVFDEAHRGKGPRAQQTRAAWWVAKQAEFRVAMTGTPVANTIADLWPLLHLVEPTWFPGKTKFLDRYATQTPNFYGGTTVLGLRPDTRDEFFGIVNPLLRRVPKSLALPQLPPKLPTQYRETPMGAKQAKAYGQMEKLMIAQLLNGELLTALNPLSQLTRLTQFAAASAELGEPYEVTRKVRWNGRADQLNDGKYALDVDGHVRLVTETVRDVELAAPSSKVDDLVDLLEEMGEAPLVVAAVSRQLIELAAERLTKEGISHGLVTGAQSTAERQVAVERFQAGQDRVILLTLGAGAEGLTLTRADTMLFMQRSYSVIQNKQAEDRIHRIGSEVHALITIVEQVTPGTVEERRLEVLAGKEDRIQEVVRDAETMAKLLGVKK